MPDVSIYVAVITAVAGVGGASVPSVAILVRDARQAKRDRGERRAEAKRLACLDLLGAAGELRTRLANAAEYHGKEIDSQLAGIRESEAAVQLHAVNVALLAPEKLAEPAEQLATAASRLTTTATAVENIDPQQGQMRRRPDFTGLDENVAAFRRIVIADVAEAAAIT
jgi:hypothetical protein